MQQFELILQNEKRRSYDQLAILFFILSSICMAIALLYFDPQKIIYTSKFYWILIPIALHTYPMILLLQKKTSSFFRNFILSIFLIPILWALIGYWWAGIATVFFVMLYKISQQELRIIFNETAIKNNFFPFRSHQWNDLNNVILKDGLLTIDFKSNKLIQQQIGENNTSLNEKEFNDFCQQQLNK
jgi:hypothetical protein